MTFDIIVTSFLYFFNLLSIIYSNNINYQRFFFIEMEESYYGIFVENLEGKNGSSKYFLGVCDVMTLENWHPCPFGCASPCRPNSSRIYHQPCNFNRTSLQPQCNCSRSLKSHQLQRNSNFPTCLLRERGHRTKRAARRTAPVINNCIQCMTKHPDVRMVSVSPLVWRRVKRGELTPSSILDHSETIKHEKLLDCHHSEFGSCALGRKYRSHVPADVENKQFYSRKLLDSELMLEHTSNNALKRILRSISINMKRSRRRKSVPQGGGDEEIEDDDDEEDDDNIGEDIAIEDDKDEESELPTTDTTVKDEAVQQGNRENKIYDFTEGLNDVVGKKLENSTHHHGNGFRKKSSIFLVTLICIVNFTI